ncbi:hypothetical protein E3P80_02712 [Wallemia ichthyophaga]|nr:hypothetical protein E3P85_02435 [Wallemia ichthyophaga]TIB45629.1 hypothetical protein E3P82_02710 [Wallemia ichthyophaga]TIB52253.1 hypothetical protein E3P80_02712 [Wallemia ichthyophaga]TIB57885.1 hypothetical protein E3P79_02710 [Wallemia ichthyophaga]
MTDIDTFSPGFLFTLAEAPDLNWLIVIKHLPRRNSTAAAAIEMYLFIRPATLESIHPGDGKNFPKPGQTITMHYHGTLLDGSVFDSSYRRGQPFSSPIGIGRLIGAWDQCVPQMSIGQKAIITATPEVGYGERGFPPVIPPNATLKFEVELLAIQ